MPTVPYWALLTETHAETDEAIIVQTLSDIPCHQWLYWTDKEPWKHPLTIIVRGVSTSKGIRWCFVSWRKIEQIEPGDTLTHTWNITDWTYCQTRWYTFRATIAALWSPSTGPIFKYHSTRLPLAVFLNEHWSIGAVEPNFTQFLEEQWTSQIPVPQFQIFMNEFWS